MGGCGRAASWAEVAGTGAEGGGGIAGSCQLSGEPRAPAGAVVATAGGASVIGTVAAGRWLAGPRGIENFLNSRSAEAAESRRGSGAGAGGRDATATAGPDAAAGAFGCRDDSKVWVEVARGCGPTGGRTAVIDSPVTFSPLTTLSSNSTWSVVGAYRILPD